MCFTLCHYFCTEDDDAATVQLVPMHFPHAATAPVLATTANLQATAATLEVAAFSATATVWDSDDDEGRRRRWR